MRDTDYFGYNSDEAYPDNYDEARSSDSTSSANTTNEMARNAVERFFESESGDYMPDYDGRKPERPEQAERTPRAIAPIMSDTGDSAWRPAAPPDFSDDDEFMAQLANIRRDRPRRDPNPTPKPAVRVNSEHRRYAPSELHDDDEADWAPLEDKEVDMFRARYSPEEDIVSPPKSAIEVKAQEPRPKSTVPAHRRRPERPTGGEGGNPLRYLLAIMFVGILLLMAFLALNNRSLRRDLDAYQSQIARIEDNTANLERLTLQYNDLNATLRQYRTQLALQGEQQPITGHDPYYTTDGTYDTSYEYGETPARPSDEYTTDDPPPPPPPPAPEQTIHIVESGQFLSHIAHIHFGSSSVHYVNLIVAANDDVTNPNDIRIGQELIIPPRE